MDRGSKWTNITEMMYLLVLKLMLPFRYFAFFDFDFHVL